MDSDPRILDGSDGPSTQPETPLLYTTFKEHLKNALLSLDGFDRASVAMLKHDNEFRDSVQRLLVTLTVTPLSELLDQAMKSGLDSIISHLSAHIPPVQPLISSQPREATIPGSTPLVPQTSLPLWPAPGPSSPSIASPPTPPTPSSVQTPKVGQSRTISLRQFTNLKNRLQIDGTQVTERSFRNMESPIYPGQMATVHFVRIVLGEWTPDPLDGLVERLNDQLQLERRATRKLPPIFQAFMAKQRRAIGLVCHALDSYEAAQMLANLRKSVDAISASLMIKARDGDSYVVTELGVLSIASHCIRTVFR